MRQLPVIIIIIAMFLFELVVSLVNYHQRTKPIPEIVRGVYDQATYNKWLSYSMESLRFSLLVKIFNTVLLLVLLLTGTFGWLERLTNAWFAQPVLGSLAFLAIIGLAGMLINLPFDYYATFVIEAKFGFNKSTRKTFFLDLIKSLLLGAVLGGLLVAGLQALFLVFAGRIWQFGLLAWVAIALVMTLLFTLNKLFVKIFNKLTPLPEGSLRSRIEELATSVGFKVNSISVMDASRRSTKLNAFFSGLGRTREVVLYDTLVEKMSEDEIVAVLAHELGHAVHKDLPRMLLQQVVLIGVNIFLFAIIAQNIGLAQAFGLSTAHFGFSLLLFGVLISPIELLLDIPLNYLSRKAEYAADAFSAQHAGGQSIHGALVRLAQENLSNLNPHPLYVWLHYNHPALAERLRAIS